MLISRTFYAVALSFLFLMLAAVSASHYDSSVSVPHVTKVQQGEYIYRITDDGVSVVADAFLHDGTFVRSVPLMHRGISIGQAEGASLVALTNTP